MDNILQEEFHGVFEALAEVLWLTGRTAPPRPPDFNVGSKPRAGVALARLLSTLKPQRGASFSTLKLGGAGGAHRPREIRIPEFWKFFLQNIVPVQ